MHVDGGAAVTRSVYDNHQGDSNWIENDLKLVLNTALYTGPALHGSVDFKIQGYDGAGNLVPGTDDTIRLYLDNKPSTGLIKNVNAGVAVPDDCAMVTLSAHLAVSARMPILGVLLNQAGMRKCSPVSLIMLCWQFKTNPTNRLCAPHRNSGGSPKLLPRSVIFLRTCCTT